MQAALLALVIATAQSQSATPPRDSTAEVKAVSGTAAISGRVTDRESGRPIPRATVTLALSDRSKRFEADADTEGRYEFTDLAPGEYAIWAGPGEHRSNHLHQALGQSSPMDFNTAPPRHSLELKANERLTDVNIALARALAIEGRILDPWDQPMSQVSVFLARPDGTPYPAPGGYSDDRGQYRLFGLKPGRYRVCAQPQVMNVMTDDLRVVRTCYPASAKATSASDVLLTTEDAIGIDIRIQRLTSFSVSGMVVDGSGAPIDGAHVVLVPFSADSVSSYAKSEHGRFRVPGLLPGVYLVRASVGGPANPSDTRPPARKLEVGYSSVEIIGSDVTDLGVVTATGQKVAGRIVFEGEPPKVARTNIIVQTGTYGLPLQRLMNGPPPFSAVDQNMTFELNEVFSFPLNVGASGLPDGWALKSVKFNGQDITGLPTDLTAGYGSRQLEIVLTNRVARPSVRVTDPNGGAVTSYRVALFASDPARWKASIGWATDMPSKDGVLELRPVVPGEYLIAALGLDDAIVVMADPTRIEALASVATRVTLAEGRNEMLELKLTALPVARR
jgi:hypothetical protein